MRAAAGGGLSVKAGRDSSHDIQLSALSSEGQHRQTANGHSCACPHREVHLPRQRRRAPHFRAVAEAASAGRQKKRQPQEKRHRLPSNPVALALRPTPPARRDRTSRTSNMFNSARAYHTGFPPSRSCTGSSHTSSDSSRRGMCGTPVRTQTIEQGSNTREVSPPGHTPRCARAQIFWHSRAKRRRGGGRGDSHLGAPQGLRQTRWRGRRSTCKRWQPGCLGLRRTRPQDSGGHLNDRRNERTHSGLKASWMPPCLLSLSEGCAAGSRACFEVLLFLHEVHANLVRTRWTSQRTGHRRGHKGLAATAGRGRGGGRTRAWTAQIAKT